MTRRLVMSVVLSSLACFGMLGLTLGLGWSPHLGLDLDGGLSVVYKPAHPVDTATLQNVANIMTQRVNALGVSQPNITTQGGNVVVQLPGVKDPNATLKVIGTTAQLYFRPVLCNAGPYVPPVVTKGATPVTTSYRTPPVCPSEFRYGASDYNPNSTAYNYPPTDPEYSSYPTTPQGMDDPTKDVILNSNGGFSSRYVLGPAVINGQRVDGTIIKSAYSQIDSTTGQWVVVFNLTGRGSTLFNEVAQTYYGQLVGDDLDGYVETAPIIETTSFPGSGQVSGNFNEQTANNLALDLNYGALPVSLVQQNLQVVSPTLGKASLRAGLFAGLLGLLLVMGYTIFYYRALGIVVILGLVTTAAFLYGFISMLTASSLGLTLDLSGVTGLIVSVGITVDSYVVYFERLKDEVRAGRSVRTAVDRGFKTAYRTIISADAVSFIGALVLWYLSIGAVRGFAFMLGISTLVDVITAYVFTRPFVILLGRNRIATEARRIGIGAGLALSRSDT